MRRPLQSKLDFDWFCRHTDYWSFYLFLIMAFLNYEKYRDAKKCFIPTCSKTDKNNPGLRFFCVRAELKENWCKLVGRDCPKRKIFCCEDHLNFEQDLENYNKWIAGAAPRLKLDATPKNLQGLKKESTPSANANVQDLEQASTSSAAVANVEICHNVAVQCEGTAMPHKAVMVKPQMKDKSTNFRSRKTKVLSRLSNVPNSEDSPIRSPSLFGSSNFDSATSPSTKNDEKLLGREHILKQIVNKPKMYLGIPKSFWWIIDYLARETSSISLHIIITLFKLKNNDSFAKMSDEFQMARSTIRLLFEKNVLGLSTLLQSCIYLPTPDIIKKNLPLVFKIRYANVQCIIDCFEIQVEKSTDPNKQAATWSQYKSCNTMKYLIACTPAGYIAFVSEGYGGRISDKAIAEKSGFIDVLPFNAVIMADRGFKEIESALSTKNIKLLRPPSVYSNQTLSKKEVIQTKVIASLRVHIERVIRKVREFHMLKPHSVVNNKHVKYLDELVVIACGLINFQDPIIKGY